MRNCRECKIGTLQITGLNHYGDGIMVACQNPNCLEEYELEPDGLGEGGMEMVYAQMLEDGFSPEELEGMNLF